MRLWPEQLFNLVLWAHQPFMLVYIVYFWYFYSYILIENGINQSHNPKSRFLHWAVEIFVIFARQIFKNDCILANSVHSGQSSQKQPKLIQGWKWTLFQEAHQTESTKTAQLNKIYPIYFYLFLQGEGSVKTRISINQHGLG